MPTTRSSSWAPLAAALGILLAGGCGSTSGSSTPADPDGSPVTVTAPTGSPAPDSELFPVTVARSGGIAGVRDEVSVAADGTVTITTRNGSGGCVLDRTRLASLREMSQSLAGADPQTLPPTPDVADGFVVRVTSPRGSAPLHDPLLGTGGETAAALVAAASTPPAPGSPCP